MTVARYMKARWSSRVACGHYVLRGQMIHTRDGATWICEPCQLAMQATAAGRQRP